MLVWNEPSSLRSSYPHLAEFLSEYPSPDGLECTLTVRQRENPAAISITLTLRFPGNVLVLPAPLVTQHDLEGDWDFTRRRLLSFLQRGTWIFVPSTGIAPGFPERVVRPLHFPPRPIVERYFSNSDDSSDWDQVADELVLQS